MDIIEANVDMHNKNYKIILHNFLINNIGNGIMIKYENNIIVDTIIKMQNDNPNKLIYIVNKTNIIKVDASDYIINCIPDKIVNDINILRNDSYHNASMAFSIKNNIKIIKKNNEIGCLKRKYKKSVYIDDIIITDNKYNLDPDKYFIFIGKENNEYEAIIKINYDYLDLLDIKLDTFIESIENNRKINNNLFNQLAKFGTNYKIVIYFTKGVFDNNPHNIEYHSLNQDELKKFTGMTFNDDTNLIAINKCDIINNNIVKCYKIKPVDFIIKAFTHNNTNINNCTLCHNSIVKEEKYNLAKYDLAKYDLAKYDLAKYDFTTSLCMCCDKICKIDNDYIIKICYYCKIIYYLLK